MIKAAMLTPNLSVGGAERWVVSLIKHSDPADLQWTGCALSGWGGMDRDIMWELAQCVPIFSEPKIEKTVPKGLPTPAAASSDDCEQYLTRVRGMPEAVRQASKDADILVAWGSHRYRNFLKSATTPGHFVLCSHSSHHKPHEIAPTKWCQTHLVAVSERAARPYNYPGNPPVTVIYNGTPMARLQPKWGRAAMREQWMTGGRRVIGYIGRQTIEKNPGAACQAMSVLDDNQWRAVYYGNLPQGQIPPRGSMIADAKRTRYPHIQFYDYTSNIGDIYAGIDVLMLASNAEAFSLTLEEGWLTRTPVVSTPVGSVPELEAKYGPLTFGVPLYPTPEQLAEACRRAVAPEGREVIERAHQLACREFTARAMANRWAVYLDEVFTAAADDSIVWTPAAERQPVAITQNRRMELDL
jgi:glycosyltransferase involved in cell wall biosynthesis